MKTTKWRSASWGVIATTAIAVGSGCAAEVGEPKVAESEELSAACVPEVPAALAVPTGNKLAFYYDAVGVQIYGCDATATGYGWVLRGPEANLYGHKGKLAGTHYAGPTWQSTDGSTVVGTKVADTPSPDPNAIPWLLLSAASHTGQGRMTEVTFIQRLETAGGKAPATGCDATHVGETTRANYTATYYFYEARGKK